MRNMRLDPQLDMHDSHVMVDEYTQLDQPPPDDPICRWVELARTAKRSHTASLAYAHIDVADTIRKLLWRPFPGTVVTSATLTVAGRFQYWRRRTGLDFGTDAEFPSPFDHARQAMLALPKDQPSPNQPNFLAATERQIIDLIRASDGGAFVLCTSYEAIQHYSRALREAGVPGPVLAQGETGKSQLLQRFSSNYRAVLVATDSFWEGVSVKGDQLRLVIIPRLPFRVPTDPLRQARHERLAKRGIDAFKAYSLPEAVIKLRQGYGRLIRSTTDRGVVVILDRRIHERAYGAILLRSLPPAQRVVGPWRMVFPRVQTFYQGTSGSTP